MRLTTTIPALPAVDVVAAAEHYRDRFGFTVHHLDAGGFAIVGRDDAQLHLWQSGDHGWRERPGPELLDRPVRTGAESFLAGTASCRIEVDDVDGLYAELSGAGVLHPTDAGAVVETTYGTREFATVDLDGNLLTFYRWS